MKIETRHCKNCGAPFEVQASRKQGCCSQLCGVAARASTHRLIYTSEYSAWRDMKARCYRAAHKDYPKYGARGITVCDRWRDSFQNFYADMGPKPVPGLSIERMNNDGNYEPSNCKWADRFEQARNKRNVWTRDQDRLLKEAIADGHNFSEIATLLGKSVSAVSGHAYRIGLRSGRPPNWDNYKGALVKQALQQGN